MEKFQAIQPSLLLAPYVRQYWFLSLDGMGEKAQRFMPAGSGGLVFNRSTTSSTVNQLQQKSHIFGQLSMYTDLVFDSFDLIIVVFQPIGASMFFRMPMNELKGQTVSFDLLNDQAFMDLENQLKSVTDSYISVNLIEKYLLNRIHHVKEYNYKRLISVFNAINSGENNISQLAQSACLEYKQFKRIFSEYVGLNPKEYLQIARFSKAIHLLQTRSDFNLNDIAGKCGYYDKSHLIKDIKMFSGYTPTKFVLNCDPYIAYKSLFQTFFIDINT